MKEYIKKSFLPLVFVFSGLLTACELPLGSSSSHDSQPPSTSYYGDNEYRTTFLNDDGAFLYASLTQKGSSAVYKGPTPTRPSTSTFEYTFKGWDKPLSNIQADTTFYAQYKEIVIVYHKVQFVNYDNSLLYEQTVQHGKNASYDGPLPTREASNNTTYTFSNWSKPYTNIIEDTIIVAQYTSQLKPYEVKFLNYDDSLLDVSYVLHGDSAIYRGVTPTKPSTEGSTYKFTGWEGDLTYITSNRTFKAKFSESIKQFKVTFIDHDGTTLYETTTNYAEAATYKGKTPFKSAKGPYQYEFEGWDKNTDLIVSDLTVRALYKEKPRLMSEDLSFEYNSSGDYYYVSRYNGNQKDVYIAKTYTTAIYGEKIVKTIGSFAFQKSTSVESIYLENTITSLDNYAFHGASKLKEIRLSDNLELIGEKAFYNTNLDKLEIPARVSSIGRNIFGSSSKKPIVKIHKDNLTYATDGTLLTSKDGKILYQAFWSELDENFIVPEGVETIEREALINKTFQTVSLPSTLKELKPYSFQSNYNLKKVRFNNSSAIIGDYAFSYCYALTEVDFGSNITQIGYSSFSGSTLTHVELPASLISVSSGSFNEVNTLSKVTLKGESEYYEVHDDCLFTKALDQIVIIPLNNTGSLTIPLTLTNIEASRFANNSFSSFHVAPGHSTYASSDGVIFSSDGKTLITTPGQLRDYNVPEGVTKINDNAFYRHRALTSISFPASLKDISNYAFYSSQSLLTVMFTEGLESIGSSAFSNTAIKEVVFPDSLETIYGSAFSDNHGITEITFGTGLKQIGESAFSSNSALQSITFNENLTSIGNYAFRRCRSLQSLVLPNSLKQIGSNCFERNTSLADITFNPKLEDIGSYAFSNCTSLTSLVLPSSVKNIRSYAFQNCTGLKYIDLGNVTASISFGAFSGNYSISSIVINSQYTLWDESPFSDSQEITSIYYFGTNHTEETKIRTYFSALDQEDLSIYFYSKEANYDGQHWRYVDGIATIWLEE